MLVANIMLACKNRNRSRQPPRLLPGGLRAWPAPHAMNSACRCRPPDDHGSTVAFCGGMATKDHVCSGQDADGTRSRGPSASLRLSDGKTVADRPLPQVTSSPGHQRGAMADDPQRPGTGPLSGLLLVRDNRRPCHLREPAGAGPPAAGRLQPRCDGDRGPAVPAAHAARRVSQVQLPGVLARHRQRCGRCQVLTFCVAVPRPVCSRSSPAAMRRRNERRVARARRARRVLLSAWPAFPGGGR